MPTVVNSFELKFISQLRLRQLFHVTWLSPLAGHLGVHQVEAVAKIIHGASLPWSLPIHETSARCGIKAH